MPRTLSAPYNAVWNAENIINTPAANVPLINQRNIVSCVYSPLCFQIPEGGIHLYWYDSRKEGDKILTAVKQLRRSNWNFGKQGWGSRVLLGMLARKDGRFGCLDIVIFEMSLTFQQAADADSASPFLLRAWFSPRHHLVPFPYSVRVLQSYCENEKTNQSQGI